MKFEKIYRKNGNLCVRSATSLIVFICFVLLIEANVKKSECAPRVPFYHNHKPNYEPSLGESSQVSNTTNKHSNSQDVKNITTIKPDSPIESTIKDVPMTNISSPTAESAPQMSLQIYTSMPQSQIDFMPKSSKMEKIKRHRKFDNDKLGEKKHGYNTMEFQLGNHKLVMLERDDNSLNNNSNNTENQEIYFTSNENNNKQGRYKLKNGGDLDSSSTKNHKSDSDFEDRNDQRVVVKRQPSISEVNHSRRDNYNDFDESDSDDEGADNDDTTGEDGLIGENIRRKSYNKDKDKDEDSSHDQESVSNYEPKKKLSNNRQKEYDDSNDDEDSSLRENSRDRPLPSLRKESSKSSSRVSPSSQNDTNEDSQNTGRRLVVRDEDLKKFEKLLESLRSISMSEIDASQNKRKLKSAVQQVSSHHQMFDRIKARSEPSLPANKKTNEYSKSILSEKHNLNTRREIVNSKPDCQSNQRLMPIQSTTPTIVERQSETENNDVGDNSAPNLEQDANDNRAYKTFSSNQDKNVAIDSNQENVDDANAGSEQDANPANNERANQATNSNEMVESDKEPAEEASDLNENRHSSIAGRNVNSKQRPFGFGKSVELMNRGYRQTYILPTNDISQLTGLESSRDMTSKHRNNDMTSRNEFNVQQSSEIEAKEAPADQQENLDKEAEGRMMEASRSLQQFLVELSQHLANEEAKAADLTKSGSSNRQVDQSYEIDNQRKLVLYDDLSKNEGQQKQQYGGSRESQPNFVVSSGNTDHNLLVEDKAQVIFEANTNNPTTRVNGMQQPVRVVRVFEPLLTEASSDIHNLKLSPKS